MPIFTFRQTITSEVSASVVSNETYVLLGASLEGNTIPTGQTVVPNVFVTCEERRNLTADNRTVLGFDIVGDDAGPGPPYTVQIMVVTYTGESTAVTDPNLGTAIDRIRDTYYNLPSGDFGNLFSDEGVRVFDRTRVLDVYNRAMRDLNIELWDDADFRTVTLVADQDWIALTGDELVIKDVIIFEASTDDRGTPMRPVSSYQQLIDEGWGLSGAPDAYLIEKGTRGGTKSRFLRFNKTPDATYTIEIRFFALVQTLATDSEISEIFEAYHETMEDLACMKICKTIGDGKRYLFFEVEYQKGLKRAKRIQQHMNNPGDRVRYQDAGLSA